MGRDGGAAGASVGQGLCCRARPKCLAWHVTARVREMKNGNVDGSGAARHWRCGECRKASAVAAGDGAEVVARLDETRDGSLLDGRNRLNT